MDPQIEELFQAVPDFTESSLFLDPAFEEYNTAAARLFTLLTEFCGTEVAGLVQEYALAETAMAEFEARYYFQQGYLAAGGRRRKKS